MGVETRVLTRGATLEDEMGHKLTFLRTLYLVPNFFISLIAALIRSRRKLGKTSYHLPRLTPPSLLESVKIRVGESVSLLDDIG